MVFFIRDSNWDIRTELTLKQSVWNLMKIKMQFPLLKKRDYIMKDTEV